MLYATETEARKAGGCFCPATLPKAGEIVDVQTDGLTGRIRTATVLSNKQAIQKAIYGGSGRADVMPDGFDLGCTVTVRYTDDGTVATLSAAVQPGDADSEDEDSLGYLAGVLACQAGISLIDASDGPAVDHRRKSENLRERLLIAASAEGESKKGPHEWPRPPSGKYWGSSDESDDGDQAIRCTLTFHPNGKLTGHGHDSVDGDYRVESGRWGVLDGETLVRLAWDEVYDDGFEAFIEGTYDPESGKIAASFTSSRAVSGAFELTKQPSVFDR